MFNTVSCRRPRRAGFTLVELLVVIGIIALLISILLPALAQAREQGKKVTCLAGLRSFGQVLQIYANDFKGRAPLGYQGNKHSGYTIYVAASSSFQQLGTLYEYGYFKGGGQAYFCPNMQDPKWVYDSPDNPWAAGSVAKDSRLGMMTRPMVRYFNQTPAGTIDKGTGMPNAAVSPYDLPENQGKYIMLSQMRDKAIAAEVFAIPISGIKTDPRIPPHKKSVNVYFADNSASSVNTGDLTDANSVQFQLGRLFDLGAAPSSAVSSEIYLDEITKPARGIWTILDKR